ncbi:SIR2 family protein [Leuconostoc citreum]|uniref:SIR2 family protein n=1 Tax=Leuconostoc citreum TaxID=33964 RepID=UPI0021A94CA4|nr:SIR2 family protein [Leuconostoc citreum]MCT3056009.1 hypothetical protein [Leuconostoc citreum]MCT3061214.1 hypothetical protein [Leuconostoc citreum]
MKNIKATFKIYESGYDKQSSKIQDKESLKYFLKNILSANVNLNVLIGSGSSLPAIPTMKTTFIDLKHQSKDLSHLIEKYKNSSSGDKDPNAENIELFLSWIGSRINGMSKDELADNEKEVKSFVIEGLIKSILMGSVCSQDNEISSTQNNYELFIKNLAFLKQLSDDENDTINLFTPNYDLFIENSLDSLGYAYSDGFKNSVRQIFDTTEYNRRPVDVTKRFKDRWSVVRPFFRVYKLHGSLDWNRTSEGSVIKQHALNSRTSEELKNAVIAPTSSKYADSQGSPFSDLFREFSIELTKSNSVLVINGYGYGDGHINDFILQALGRPDFKLVAFLNEEEPNAKKFMERVGSSAGATFITNSEDFNQVHYFSTLVELLKYDDPFDEVEINEK